MPINFNDLHSPLGVSVPGSSHRRHPIALIPLISLTALVSLISFWAALVNDPLGGEPYSIVRIERDSRHTNRSEVAIVGVKSLDQRESSDINDLLGAGKDGANAAGASTDRKTRRGVMKLDDLLEETRMGKIPRIGTDGTRPLDAYSQPMSRVLGAAPKVVVVVTGLGLSQTATQAALDKLNPNFTLAFSPYGASLERWTTRARTDGHETLLQVPMEPYDYPDNDPGPQTLVTSAGAVQNIERLQWVMSRITGYVGVVNTMGARATSDNDTMRPVLGEIAKRGLMYLDDGSSSRSVVKDLAGPLRLPYSVAQIILDAVPSPTEIDARISRLETAARTTGLAIGIASNLPITVDRLADWSKSLEARGLVLVPISSTVEGQGGSAAEGSAPEGLAPATAHEGADVSVHDTSAHDGAAPSEAAPADTATQGESAPPKSEVQPP